MRYGCQILLCKNSEHLFSPCDARFDWQEKLWVTFLLLLRFLVHDPRRAVSQANLFLCRLPDIRSAAKGFSNATATQQLKVLRDKVMTTESDSSASVHNEVTWAAYVVGDINHALRWAAFAFFYEHTGEGRSGETGPSASAVSGANSALIGSLMTTAFDTRARLAGSLPQGSF